MSSGRPREFDETQALQAAMEYFWSRGYEAASLQNLLKTMQLSRSSFYQTFESKQVLFERCLAHYRDHIRQRLTSLYDNSESGLAFIRAVLDDRVNQAASGKDRNGCLILNTASEFAQRDQPIAEFVSSSTRQLRQIFVRAIKRAQQEGDIDPDRDASALAAYVLNNLSGLNNLLKAGADKTTLRNIVNIVMESLH